MLDEKEKTMIELTKGPNRLVLLPELGGAVGEWTHDGQDIFLPVANPDLRAQKGEAVAAYPLVPYSNRIAHGRFTFDGTTYHLDRNMGEHPHTIHGNGWERPWAVMHKTDSHAILALEHWPRGLESQGVKNQSVNTQDVGSQDAGSQENATEDTPDDSQVPTASRAQDRQWPFAYRATLSFQLHDDGLMVDMVVENIDTVEQPVGFGFHPFLAAQGAATLHFTARTVWITDGEGLPVRQEKADRDWSFDPPADAHARSIDNAFAGFAGHVALKRSEAGLKVTIESDPIFEHVVLFTAPDKPFVAIEPVTNMTDAVNRPDVPGRGLHRLKPGTRTGGRMRFRVGRLD